MNDWIEIDSDAISQNQAKWLIIDESTFILAQFREVLKPMGLHFFEARDVVSAIELINCHEDIDVIICDVNLMRMNGAALVQSLPRKAQKQTPIYLLSAESKVDLVADAQKFGAAGWISKPPKSADLAALLNNWGHPK